jgi:uncharacterized protein
MGEAPSRPRPASPCPVCGRPADVVLRPFCSKRCADVDLHRWLSGSYRIPVEDEADDAENQDGPEGHPG